MNEDMLVCSFDTEDIGDRQHVEDTRQGLQHRRREPVLVFLGQSRRELDLHGVFTSNLRSLSCVSTITQKYAYVTLMDDYGHRDCVLTCTRVLFATHWGAITITAGCYQDFEGYHPD